MEEFLQNQLAKLQQEWMRLTEMRGNASPDARGGFIVRIEAIETEMEQLEKDLEKCRKKKQPIQPIIKPVPTTVSPKTTCSLKQAKDYIGKGRIEDAISCLENIFPDDNVVTLLSGRYSRLQRQTISGTLSTDTQFREMALLSSDILDFIKSKNG